MVMENKCDGILNTVISRPEKKQSWKIIKYSKDMGISVVN